MNDTYFNTPTYNHSWWRKLVVCQEIGHTLGLDHQDENFDNTNSGTCMDYTSNPLGPPSNEYPNRHDYDELEIIYSHLDDTTTVGQTANNMPPAANEIDFSGPAQWGKVDPVDPRRPDRALRARFRRWAQGIHIRHLGGRRGTREPIINIRREPGAARAERKRARCGEPGG
jgi:hypothetical protein